MVLDFRLHNTTYAMQADGSVRYQVDDKARNRDDVGTDGAARSLGAILVPIRAKVEEIRCSQEILSNARQNMLVERSRIRSRAEDVRSQRMTTGDAVANFMNHLREFFNENRDLLPPSITKAYEKVVQERDRLGPDEDDFSQAEQSYLREERSLDGQEWKFQQEERFMYQYQLPDLFTQIDSTTLFHNGQRSPPQLSLPFPPLPPPPPPPVLEKGSTLVSNPPPPPPPLSLDAEETAHESQLSPTVFEDFPVPRNVEQEYHSAASELDRIRREFDSLRPYQSELLEQGETKDGIPTNTPIEFREKYMSLLKELSESEVKVQRLRLENMQVRTPKAQYSRRASDSLRKYGPSFDTITRAYTDGAVPSTYDNAAIRSRIREWSGRITYNVIEKSVYRNMLESKGISVPDLASLDPSSGQYWHSDPPGRSPSSEAGVEGSLGTNDTSLGHSQHPPQRPATDPLPEHHPCSRLDEQLWSFRKHSQT
ncbi:hypothetical protein BU23DRAFT_200266 [Bimuria novae-zelandiae CBS 107.79]|uniref:Uncharacterized protein n=1 Tax=Bimuria novae-zelandiae CBS 107.79 TaxID=1447943 RepID=A0A6A5V260_9PLEO|nr:hypothetical protein BU23DRAFT_200266 [Bimuria novae-zelandiae CBS 107.79]